LGFSLFFLKLCDTGFDEVQAGRAEYRQRQDSMNRVSSFTLIGNIFRPGGRSAGAVIAGEFVRLEWVYGD
jgi:hypothetical protein